MKKVARLLLNSLLVVMIVFLTSGVSLMECMHSGRITIAQLDAEECMTDDCLPATSHNCMKVVVVKLSPTQQVQSQANDMVLLPLLVAFMLGSPICTVLFSLPGRTLRTRSQVEYSPPRMLLRRLRRLLI